jgi:hypothetical protein
MEYGILYAATGGKYIKECWNSLKSLKKAQSENFASIFTDDCSSFSGFAEFSQYSIHKLPDPKYGFEDKISALLRSPYDKTLFLDTDTLVLSNPVGLFDLLENFDLAACMETYKPHPLPSVPDAFPEFNTGVMALQTGSRKVKDFLRNWLELYREQRKSRGDIKHDQPAFREALYRSNLRISPLASDWNFFICHPAILNAGETIKILHTRIPDSDLSQNLKIQTQHSRVFLPNLNSMHPERIGSSNRFLDIFLSLVMIPFRIWSGVYKLFISNRQ